MLTKEKLKILDNIPLQIEKDLYNTFKYTKEINDIVKDHFLNKKGFIKIYLEGESYLGKSSLVKKYAELIPNANFLRIDLKEYKSSIDINKLIGTTQGYIGYNDEHLFNKLANNNFTIILFDNYSEAHQNVKDLIKEILKEGYITDNKGEKIYFNNSLIFITDDTLNNNHIGFNNDLKENISNEINDLVDKTITFDGLTKEILTGYLKSQKVKNIEDIIKRSNYEIYNYKNISKLMKENNLINN